MSCLTVSNEVRKLVIHCLCLLDKNWNPKNSFSYAKIVSNLFVVIILREMDAHCKIYQTCQRKNINDWQKKYGILIKYIWYGNWIKILLFKIFNNTPNSFNQIDLRKNAYMIIPVSILLSQRFVSEKFKNMKLSAVINRFNLHMTECVPF